MSPVTDISVDSRNFKKWGGGGGGGSPTTAKIVAEGLKILGDDFMINFKLMENISTVYLAILTVDICYWPRPLG